MQSVFYKNMNYDEDNNDDENDADEDVKSANAEFVIELCLLGSEIASELFHLGFVVGIELFL